MWPHVQVVAGTNYAFAFDAAYSCAGGSGTTRLNAVVYQPLSSSNAAAQVRSPAKLSHQDTASECTKLVCCALGGFTAAP